MEKKTYMSSTFAELQSTLMIAAWWWGSLRWFTEVFTDAQISIQEVAGRGKQKNFHFAHAVKADRQSWQYFDGKCNKCTIGYSSISSAVAASPSRRRKSPRKNNIFSDLCIERSGRAVTTPQPSYHPQFLEKLTAGFVLNDHEQLISPRAN